MRHQLKILLVNPFADSMFGGSGIIRKQLREALVELGAEVDEWTYPALTRSRLRKLIWLFLHNPILDAKVSQAVALRCPDIIHACDASVLRGCLGHNIPVVFEALSLIPPSSGTGLDSLFRGWSRLRRTSRSMQRCREVICASSDMASYLKSVHSVNATIIPHVRPLPGSEWLRRHQANDYILFVGRFAPDKGADIFFRLAKENPDQQFVACGLPGPVPPPALPNLGVHLNVAPEAVAKFYAKAKLVVIPSRVEGFGLVALEARNSGCSILSSGAGALPEVLAEYAGAVITDLRNFNIMLQALLPGLLQSKYPLRQQNTTQWAEQYLHTYERITTS